MARQGWGRHTVVATGSNDGTKQVSVNAWNNDLNETGMLGFDIETKTLSSDALTPLSTANIVAGEGASADDFSYITYGAGPEVAEEDILFFYKGSQVITVTHNTGSAPSNSGNIQLLNGASKVLNTNLPLILQRKGNVFYEIISSAGTTVTAGSTTTFTNKSIDLTDNTLTGSSAELATAISDETGSGALVFGTSPTFVTPVLGQPASGNLTDCTFPTLNQSTTGSSATCTGLAGSATNVITTDDSSDTTCNVVFVNDPAATQAAKTGTNLTFNASSGVLTATGFAGPLTGAVTGNADTATTAGTVTTAAQGNITSVGTLTSLGVGAITTSGLLTMGDNIITGIKSLDMDIDVLTYGATTDIDFGDNEVETLSLTGNIIFTGSNYAIGKHKTLHMVSDGSARTFTFPSGWVFYGTKPTTTVASKKSILSLTCLGSAEADVRAVFVEEA
jgi:hypothetical protein